jgi:hypothetical protein
MSKIQSVGNLVYYTANFGDVSFFQQDLLRKEQEILKLPVRDHWNVATSSREALYNVFAFPEPEYKVLADWINGCWKEFADTQGVRREAYTQCWLNVFHEGNSFPAHIHRTSFHGVFIVRGGDSSTRFHYTDDRSRPAVHDIPSVDGQLVLVRGWYPHEVAPWHGEGNRITLAFDIFYDDHDFGQDVRSEENRRDKAYTSTEHAILIGT